METDIDQSGQLPWSPNDGSELHCSLSSSDSLASGLCTHMKSMCSLSGVAGVAASLWI